MENAEAVGGFAVCTIKEGLDLRQHGIKLPILSMTSVANENLQPALEADLTLTVLTTQDAVRVKKAAEQAGRRADVHLKIDTGLGRLGHFPERAAVELKAIQEMEGVRLTGVYSHLADIDGNAEYTAEQGRLFTDFCRECGVEDLLLHLAPSGVNHRPELTFCAVRIGLALFGAYQREQQLEPVMTLKSRIIFKKKIPQGQSVSYGRTFIAPHDMEVAVVGAGYANGFMQVHSNTAEVSVRGHRAPVLGVVCMDQLMIDADAAPGCEVGDEVLFFGLTPEDNLPIWEVATRAGIIPYELCCLAGPLNHRTFLP